MADEYTTSGNWWESSRNRFEATTPSSTSSGLTSVGSFGWLTDMATTAAHMKLRSSSSSMDHSLGPETNLQMMKLGLSSQTVNWNHNQPLLRPDKASETSFRSMLQQDSNVSSNTSFPGQEEVGIGSSRVQWRPSSSSESFMMQGSENPQNQHSGFDNSSINGYSSNSYQATYGLSSDEQLLPPNWSKVHQFLRGPPRKPPPSSANSGQLQFSNNVPFWTASTAASPPVIDVRPSFFPPTQQTQFSSPNFEEKPNKNLLEVISTKSSTAVPKKSSSQATNKRPRNETKTPLPAFKVRKEKVGDRITTLQQLVSPFGKTDTASVLTEAIDYIKILHEKVYELSIPYLKNRVAMSHHQNIEKSKLDHQVLQQDLRSRGLCLVPLSITYPICTAHETNFDFWNPTFGGTYR